MKIGKNQMVTLDDGRKYIITSETMYNNNKFFLLAGILEDESDLNNQFQIAKEVLFEGETYLEEVEDPDMLKQIIPLFDKKEGE
ncbi:MAG TPA: hypothetical protein PLX66_00920 [Bacilli bacterium]|nr:hypothetical protein [Bacilli bacterium]